MDRPTIGLPDATVTPPEMVIDWELVPQNVPDNARLITEADDEGRPGVCVQFWRLPNGKSLRTATRGSVMVPGEEPGPGGPKPGGNAPSGSLPAGDAGFDATLNTPEADGPLTPLSPSRRAPVPEEAPGQDEMPETGVPALVSPKAYINAAGRKVRPSDGTRSQVARIQMLNAVVDSARLGSNAPKEQEAPARTMAQPGNPTPPTRPAQRKPVPAPRPVQRQPARAVPRASFD